MIQTWRIYRISAISHILPHRKSELRAHAANIALLHLIRLYLKENNTVRVSENAQIHPRTHNGMWMVVCSTCCVHNPPKQSETYLSYVREADVGGVMVSSGPAGSTWTSPPAGPGGGTLRCGQCGAPPLRRPSRFSSLVLTFSRDG